MIIGITGTRTKITVHQEAEVRRILSTWNEPNSQLHHGDCVGADVTVAQIAKELGYFIVCHPPPNNDLRGFFSSNEERLPLTYFARNRQIVEETQVLLVVPYQMEWQPKGGTWYTHDYAVKKKKPVHIIWPEKRT